MSAATLIPPTATLDELREIARGCRAFPLWERGTQTVFGEGARHAPILLAGEQPGNDEDLSGHPFVGPAGKLLDKALAEAGIERERTWVTNAVKHFKWEARGKRRIHAKPNSAEVAACVPWLESEVRLVKPKLIVCLGATAAQALLGRTFRVTKQRGEVLESRFGPKILATIHPSAILRATDAESRHTEYSRFVEDLKVAAAFAVSS